MSGPDQFPLALNAVQTTEAAKTTDFFDLAEDGFDGGFAQGVQEFSNWKPGTETGDKPAGKPGTDGTYSSFGT